MCLLWLQFLSLFGGNSIVCRAIPCWFHCNSLFVVICYSLVLLPFLHCEASSWWCYNSSLFCLLLLQFLVWICLAQNACLLLGLLQISAPVLFGCHSCLFLMPPYKNALTTLKFSLVHCKSILLQTNSNWGLPFLSVFYAPCKCTLVFFFCTATAECDKQIPTWVVTIINVHDDNK